MQRRKRKRRCGVWCSFYWTWGSFMKQLNHRFIQKRVLTGLLGQCKQVGHNEYCAPSQVWKPTTRPQKVSLLPPRQMQFSTTKTPKSRSIKETWKQIEMVPSGTDHLSNFHFPWEFMPSGRENYKAKIMLTKNQSKISLGICQRVLCKMIMPAMTNNKKVTFQDISLYQL